MRQSRDSHETVYYSTPVADFADMFVLVCSMKLPPMQQGGRMAMALSLRRGPWQKKWRHAHFTSFKASLYVHFPPGKQ